jgi:hypothetical protein
MSDSARADDDGTHDVTTSDRDHHANGYRIRNGAQSTAPARRLAADLPTGLPIDSIKTDLDLEHETSASVWIDADAADEAGEYAAIYPPEGWTQKGRTFVSSTGDVLVSFELEEDAE